MPGEFIGWLIGWFIPWFIGFFIELWIPMILSGAWLLTLALIADALLGLPLGWFSRELRTDPEAEALRSKLLTPKVLKLRLIVAPVVLVAPTFAVTRLAPGVVNDGVLQYLPGLTILYVGFLVYTSAARLWSTRRRRKDRQE